MLFFGNDTFSFSPIMLTVYLEIDRRHCVLERCFGRSCPALNRPDPSSEEKKLIDTCYQAGVL